MKTIKVTGWDDVPKDFTGRVLMLGLTSWLQNGITHRLDGPAIETYDDEKSYWILGKHLTQQEFDVFQYLWKNSTYKKTEELMITIVKLVKMK